MLFKLFISGFNRDIKMKTDEYRKSGEGIGKTILKSFLSALIQSYGSGGSGHSVTVYSADECVGPVIMGRCHGSIIPKSAWQKKCYGQMLNGQCTGPMF